MEVHHHPDLHHKEKKWKEYFLEFLMIFLAVSMGFLAESYRERLLDREKEKQSIESLIQCLASDTVQLKSIISANIKVVGQLDSLLLLKNSDLSIAENKRKFLLHSIIGFNEDWYFRTNDAALQQLKSSGMLRLIRKQNIIDSIFMYDLKNRATVAQETDCYFLFKDDFLDYKRAVDLSFFGDTTVLKYDLGYKNSIVTLRDINGISISADREKIKSLFGNAATLALPEQAYVHLMQEQLSYGKRLIAFLKQEYHLE
jgi:hypothetical protein